MKVLYIQENIQINKNTAKFPLLPKCTSTSRKVPLVIQLFKKSVFHNRQKQIPWVTGMSFETVALFSGSSLIKFKTSFLETVSKEKFSLPKFSFIFLQLSSFLKVIFFVDSRRFKPLLILVKYSLKVLEIIL